MRNLAARFGIPRVSARFAMMVWLPLVVNVFLTIATRGDPERKALVAESRELYFAVAIALFTWIALLVVRNRAGARSRTAPDAIASLR